MKGGKGEKKKTLAYIDSFKIFYRRSNSLKCRTGGLEDLINLVMYSDDLWPQISAAINMNLEILK